MFVSCVCFVSCNVDRLKLLPSNTWKALALSRSPVPGLVSQNLKCLWDHEWSATKVTADLHIWEARRWNILIIYAEIWGIIAFILEIYLEYVTHLAALSLWDNEGGINRKLLLFLWICPCLPKVCWSREIFNVTCSLSIAISSWTVVDVPL